MIKKFKQFEELNRDTYLSAANKLYTIGHENRYKKLYKWSHIGLKNNAKVTPYELGLFNFDFNVYSFKQNGMTKIFFCKSDLLESKIREYRIQEVTLVNKGAISGYITNVSIDTSLYDDAEMAFVQNGGETGEDFDHDWAINLTVSCIFVDGDEILKLGSSFALYSPFSINVKAKWENNELKIIDAPPTIFDQEYGQNSTVLFSDRRSATKFKQILSKWNENYPKEFDQLRNFFMQYSSSKEFEKYIDKLKSIPINRFYRD